MLDGTDPHCELISIFVCLPQRTNSGLPFDPDSRLASSMSQLLQGRVFDHFSVKWAFLLHLIVFEVGALISGAAPSSVVFIVGRVISGLGFSGISQGCMVSVLPFILEESRVHEPYKPQYHFHDPTPR